MYHNIIFIVLFLSVPIYSQSWWWDETTSTPEVESLIATDMGDYETAGGDDNFNAYGTNTLERSTDQAVGGTYSLKISYVDNANGFYAYLKGISTGGVLTDHLVADSSYVLSGWMATNGVGDGVRLAVQGLIETDFVDGTTWIEFSLPFVAVGGDSEQYFYLNGDLGAGEVVYLDGLQLVKRYLGW